MWRSDSYSLHVDKVLAKSQETILQFPRLSPDGTTLAYLFGDADRIMLHNVRTGKEVALATIRSDWEGMYPVMGCPFCWSPDGKKIAYVDGTRIKIVNVKPKPTAGAR